MKTTIDKARVMSRAWAILRREGRFSKFAFRWALIRAWEVENRNIAIAQREAEQAADRAMMAARKAERGGFDMPIVPDFGVALTNWYSNAPRGTYFGD